jgi:transposase-like protein
MSGEHYSEAFKIEAVKQVVNRGDEHRKLPSE